MISLITGESVLHETDFRLSGPISLEWTRNYFSHVERTTMLGRMWQLNYDQSVRIDRREGSFFWANKNGNIVEIPYIPIEDSAVITEEKIVYSHYEDSIVIEDYDEDLSYHYSFVGGSRDTYYLTKISRHRFEISFKYNVSARLEEIVDSSNRTLTIERDSQQRIISVTQVSETEQEKVLVEYDYDEEGYLTVVRDTIGQEETYTYHKNLITVKTDKNGVTQHWEFENTDEDPKCIKRWFTKRGQQLERIKYEDGKTVLTDAIGASIEYWHRHGKLVQVTDAMGNSETWEYNLNAQVIRYTDKLDNSTYYGYDDYGNKTSERLPNGGSTNYIYENNKLVMAKNAKNAVWIWQYNEEGFLTVRIGPAKDITRYEYTNDLLTKVIDANGLETHLEYNNENTLDKVTLPTGEVTNWNYNGQGQLLHAVSNQDTSVNYHYDELGRVEQMKTVDGNMVHLKYDGVGNVISAKDKHRDVKFEYSPTGKLESREENETKIKFSYTKADQLKAITNEHQSLYRFDRDRNGQIIQESGFDGLKRKYQRNAGGQVSQRTTPDGRKVGYSYDLLGNVSVVNYDDGTKEAYTYDKSGLLIEAVNENGIVSLERDEIGRVIAETQNGVRIENEYNRVGQRIHLTSSLGADIKISRDKFGNILNTSVEQSTQSEDQQSSNRWEVDITRNLVGLEIERSLPGGVTSSWQRDKNGRPVQHSVTAKEQLQTKKRYQWDVNDRLRSIEDLLKKELTTFEHDVFGNLSAASYADGSWDYKLPDEIGNLFKTKDKTDRKYGRAGQLLKDEKYTFEYDEVGNLIKKESLTEAWRYKWSQGGMLKKVIRPDRKHVDFTYDALGRRLTKTYHDQTTHFVWDGNVPLHEWTSTREETTGINESASGRPLSGVEVDESGNLRLKSPENLTTWIFEDGTFIPMAKLQGDKAYSIITDHLGTPIESYDEEGKKVWSRELGIYGQTRKEIGEENFIPFLYQGQYLDTETKLGYNRYRYYSPESGTYVSQDPIGLDGQMPNMYAYVLDSNSWIDPFGQECLKHGFKGSMEDLRKSGKTASDLPTITPGTNQWNKSVKKAQEALGEGKKYQVRVDSSTNAKKFLDDVHGNMNRRKAHTQSKRPDGVPKYKKGYEQHQGPESSPMDLQHIKWYNNGTDGHIFYNTPN
ncbi:MAG: RHS repeat-associated core domain-containing protein [Crocinitomicaceae bacterium]